MINAQMNAIAKIGNGFIFYHSSAQVRIDAKNKQATTIRVNGQRK